MHMQQPAAHQPSRGAVRSVAPKKAAAAQRFHRPNTTNQLPTTCATGACKDDGAAGTHMHVPGPGAQRDQLPGARLREPHDRAGAEAPVHDGAHVQELQRLAGVVQDAPPVAVAGPGGELGRPVTPVLHAIPARRMSTPPHSFWKGMEGRETQIRKLFDSFCLAKEAKALS